MRPSVPFFGALAMAALVFHGAAQPVPKLDSISKPWLQRGTTTRLTLKGEHLEGAEKIVISGAPGLAAQLVPESETRISVESSLGGIRSAPPPDRNEVVVDLSIEPAAPPVTRELRVVSARGVSNPLPVHVGPLPELESEARTKREEAQNVDLPAAITGVLDKPALSHFFKFGARKNRHVILEVRAARDQSKLDSSLAVLTLEGRELARNEDAAGLDSILDFNPPEDGQYIAELRDFRYEGGGDFTYRLLAGVMPYVASIFPFGGQRGKSVEIQLEGSNLEGAGKLRLQLDADAPLQKQEIRAATPLGLSNPFLFEVSDLPSRRETEPNSALDQADEIPIPVAIDGRIGSKKDYDAFRFHARKGQRIVFQTEAFAFGSRLDAVLILTDDRGNVLARNDDANAVDARIDYRFKEEGAAFIMIEDLLGRGGNDFPYRLTAQTPPPDFAVSVSPDTPRIHRGGHVPIRCELSRFNGFNAPVKVVCESLPPGIHAEPLIFSPDGPGVGLLMLAADAGAPLGSFPLRIAGFSLSAGDTSLRRESRPYSGDRAVDQSFLTVLDAAPFSIIAGTLLASVEQNQSGTIEVMVERSDGFEGEIKVIPESFSPAREGISRSFEFQPLILKAGQISGALTLRAKTDAELGARPTVLRAEASLGESLLTDYSLPIPVATAEIPFVTTTSLKKLVVIALPESAGSAASEAVFSVKVNRRMGFDGALKVSLEGVPDGVKANVTDVSAGESEAAIKLVATEKAEAGKDYSIIVTAAGTHQDRTYRFKADPVVLTIKAPEMKNEAKVAATL